MTQTNTRNLELLAQQEQLSGRKFQLYDYIQAQKQYCQELYFEAVHEDHALTHAEFMWEYTCGKFQVYRQSFENMYLGQGHKLDWGAHKKVI